MNGASSLAHTRYEYLGPSQFPRVAIIVKDTEFQLWDRFVDSYNLKIGSQRSYSYSLGLFIDFLATRADEFKGSLPSELPTLFISFSDNLLLGTVEHGYCPHNLWWKPRSVTSVLKIITRLTKILDWVAEDKGINAIFPTRESTLPEQLKFWSRWNILKGRSLLGHLKKRKSEANSSSVSGGGTKRPEVLTSQAPKRFPHQHFHALLNTGFKRRHDLRWSTLRDQMILLLLDGAGLRLSEAITLWSTDVFYEDPDYPDAAVVRLYEPHEGEIEYFDALSGTTKTTTRADYLKTQFNMMPLSMAPGRRNVGSKPNLYQDSAGKYTLAYWRSHSYARAFKGLSEFPCFKAG